MKDTNNGWIQKVHPNIPKWGDMKTRGYKTDMNFLFENSGTLGLWDFRTLGNDIYFIMVI